MGQLPVSTRPTPTTPTGASRSTRRPGARRVVNQTLYALLFFGVVLFNFAYFYNYTKLRNDDLDLYLRKYVQLEDCSMFPDDIDTPSHIIKRNRKANVGTKIRFYMSLKTSASQLRTRCPPGSELSNRISAFEKDYEDSLFDGFGPRSIDNLLAGGVGRGVVMAAYDGMVHLALAHITIMRELSEQTARDSASTSDADPNHPTPLTKPSRGYFGLPVEVFYMGDEDLNPQNQKLLTSLPGVKMRDISTLIDLEKLRLKGTGWAIKPFALLLSSFREAILVDADTTFLQDPASLFDDPDYIKTGALFFHDKRAEPPRSAAVSWVKSLLPPDPSDWSLETRYSWILKRVSHYQQESGVVVLDKARAGFGLLGACQLLTGAHRAATYRYMFGDKETFWLGMAMAQLPYSFHPQPAGILGLPSPYRRAVCGSSLLHFTRSGNAFWLNGGILVDKKDVEHPVAGNYTAYARELLSTNEVNWRKYGTNFYCLNRPFAFGTLREEEVNRLDHYRHVTLQAMDLVKSSGYTAPDGAQRKTYGSGDGAAVKEAVLPSVLQFLQRLEAARYNHVAQTACKLRGDCVDFRRSDDLLRLVDSQM